MKNRIIKILSSIFQWIDTCLCRLHIKRPKVIFYVDGGICSQMLIYAQGQYYAEQGLDVYFDISWFSKCGKDSQGIMPRIFELTEMWPKLHIKTITERQHKWYLLFFQAKRTNGDLLPEPASVKHTIYFYEYWDLPSVDYKRLFAYTYDLSEACMITKWEEYSFKDTVGVHVRRGDLAKGDNPVYGGVSDGYFLRAIDFCNQQFKPNKYIFFSDEPDWVEQNICNHLTRPYEIMRGNKAWEDFWVLAHCPIIVASQGSFGKVAARFNKDAILIQCDNKHAERDRINTYLIK